jgi:hypothetical protein
MNIDKMTNHLGQQNTLQSGWLWPPRSSRIIDTDRMPITSQPNSARQQRQIPRRRRTGDVGIALLDHSDIRAVFADNSIR